MMCNIIKSIKQKLDNLCLPNRHTVNIIKSPNGRIFTDRKKYKKGYTIEIIILPNDGFVLNSLIVKDDLNNEILVTNNTFIAPDSNVTIIATFVNDTYEVPQETSNIIKKEIIDTPRDYITELNGEKVSFQKPKTAQDYIVLYYDETKKSDTEDYTLYTPYVAWKFRDGRMCWNFLGFVFNFNCFYNKDGVRKNIMPMSFNNTYSGFVNLVNNCAKKQDWLDHLDSLFKRNKAIDAIDKCIESLKPVLGEPVFRHKILIGLPMPLASIQDWGELNGEHLDFRDNWNIWMYNQCYINGALNKSYLPEGFVSEKDYSEVPAGKEYWNKEKYSELKYKYVLLKNSKNRAKAIKWYVQEIINRFNALNYKNVDLAGFYWINEDHRENSLSAKEYAFDSKILDNFVINGLTTTECSPRVEISDYIHSLGYTLNWSPYLSTGTTLADLKKVYDNIYTQCGFGIKTKCGFENVYQALNKCSGKSIDGTLLSDYGPIGFNFESVVGATTDAWYYIAHDDSPNNSECNIGTGEIFRDRIVQLEKYFTDNNLFDRRFAHLYYDGSGGNYKGMYWLVASRLPYGSDSVIYTNKDSELKKLWRKNLENEIMPLAIVDVSDRIMKHIIERQGIVYESCPKTTSVFYEKYKDKFDRCENFYNLNN